MASQFMELPGIGNQDCSRVSVSIVSSGANVVIAAVAGKTIKVFGLMLIAANDVDVTFKESVSAVALTGPISMGVKGNGFVLNPSQLPWLQPAEGQGLNINLSAAVQVSGVILYSQV